jgi:hypothetical protein
MVVRYAGTDLVTEERKESRMWRRIGLMIALALMLIVPASSGRAAPPQYPLGRADLTGATVTGTAFVIRLENTGESQVTARVAGLPASGQYAWEVLTGDSCQGVGTSLIRPAQDLIASSVGVALGTTTVATTVPVGGSLPGWVAIRVYSVPSNGQPVPPGTPSLACGALYSLPDTTGTRHWW